MKHVNTSTYHVNDYSSSMRAARYCICSRGSSSLPLPASIPLPLPRGSSIFPCLPVYRATGTRGARHTPLRPNGCRYSWIPLPFQGQRGPPTTEGTKSRLIPTSNHPTSASWDKSGIIGEYSTLME